MPPGRGSSKHRGGIYTITMRRIPITLQIILYILETSLQLDVAISHGQADDIRHICLILIGVILIMSSAVFNVVSIVWIYRTMDFSGKKLGNAVCILMHILQVGPVWRYFKIVLINDSQDVRELLTLRTMQATLQTLPFLVIQGYTMLAATSHPIVHIVSVVVSMLSVTLAYTSYQGQEDVMQYKLNNNPSSSSSSSQSRRNFTGFRELTWGLLFLVKLLLLSGRVLSLAMFIQACTLWIILLLGVHMATYGTVVYLMRRIFHCSNIVPDLANTLQSAVHVFDHLCPCHQFPKSELISFYVLISLENVTMGLLWYLTEKAVSFKALLFAGTLVCLLLGILLLCLYHGCTFRTGIAAGNKDIECENHDDISQSPTIESAGDLDTPHQTDIESIEDNDNDADRQTHLAGTLDLTRPSGDRTCPNDTDLPGDIKSSRAKTRSHSFSCAMGQNRKVNSEKEGLAGDKVKSEKEGPAGDKSVKECGVSECESGIDLAQCEAMVDEHWLAGQTKRTICQTDEDHGSGYFSGGDGFDIATIHSSSLTGGTASCSLTSFPSPTEAQQHRPHYDSGYCSKGDRTSSGSSTTSSPKNNTIKLSVVDLPQQVPKSSKKYSFANRYPQLLDTTAVISHNNNNNNYESSITSCCSCSQQTSTLSSAAVSDSDDISSNCVARDTKPTHWKTLPPARSKEWQKMLHGNAAENSSQPQKVVHLKSLSVVHAKQSNIPENNPTHKTVTRVKSSLQYDSRLNSQEWYKTWHTPYESSMYSSTDLCSQSMYDLRRDSDSSSFCTTCCGDELDNVEETGDGGSETDFTMTWPPSNKVNQRNLNRLPQDSLPSEQHVAQWLKQVYSCQPAIILPDSNADSCDATSANRVLGRRETCGSLCTHTNDCDKLPAACKTIKPHRTIIKHSVTLNGKPSLLAKSMLRSLCAAPKNRPRRLYPYNVSGSAKDPDRNSPFVGKETVV